MHQAEIDAIIAGARASLLRAFAGHLRASGLVELQRCCFPIFQVSVKKRRYALQVSCAEAPAERDLIEESPGSPMRVRVDPQTGERRVILSMTPRALAVFKAYTTFAAPSVPVVEATGDAAELRRALAAGALTVNEAWREQLGVAAS